MSSKKRITYLFAFVIVLCEMFLLGLDVSIFYAIKAKTYLLPSGFIYLKDILASLVFIALYALIRKGIRLNRNDQTNPIWIEPSRGAWDAMVTLVLIIGAIFVYDQTFPEAVYRRISNFGLDFYAPESLYTIFKSHFITLLLGSALLAGLITIERLILYKRTKNTAINFALFIIALFGFSFSMAGTVPGAQFSPISLGLGITALILMFINAFRVSWILPMSRQDKWQIMGLTVIIGICGLILLNGFHFPPYLLWYSSFVGHFLLSLTAFVTLYFCVSFLGILIYLPSSRDFERKSEEVRKLYKMSKFITDVFDEDKIYTSLIRFVCESIGENSLGWFDLYVPNSVSEKAAGTFHTVHYTDVSGTKQVAHFRTVATNNVSSNIIAEMQRSAGFIWQQVLEKKDIVQVDDMVTDKRLNAKIPPIHAVLKRLNIRKRHPKPLFPIGSIVSVPLTMRSELIGIIHVAKDVEFSFIREDLELITIFADQAAIAIDNSRLIKQLIGKERLEQQLEIAREIQSRLLPQEPLQVPGFDMAGISEPAYEVGGDYYDFFQLDDGDEISRFGIVIADVSGKGTSAAFYMAELKGIIQSLCKVYPDAPRDLLKKANETLSQSLGKNAYISLLYGVVDVKENTLSLVNAGHCPAAAVMNKNPSYLKLQGLALGLDTGKIFNQVVSKNIYPLADGDVIVFYTDGVVEAINHEGKQFGYDRLLKIVNQSREKNAKDITNDIFTAVNDFTKTGGAVRDDLTLVVVKKL
ncbi:protein serine/threonine phosphatase [Chloroherpeton thalassium ATCC 35110]|uniref:Protein serine/threonine phosphatase n=1 Tax=Chloroherpeton thalassium (strain ATCC 35110 / GB-78) TaxID=517418 RepID=B3QTE8_CHLT3|nr:GAF domain-containing SpoIIE family protein phosphatase [Chloroherpeton thalassium]ACF12694.1 protein serine/threonine phosphatase [Chloroherpeton thalassium ATCC 35110]